MDRAVPNGASALLTDLYELTMAYGYWASGREGLEASFYVAFRCNPFDGGFAVTCGLEPLIGYLRDLTFTDDDLAYLASLRGNDGEPLFAAPFLEYLSSLRFTCDVDAIEEGTVVFPNEPVLRVTGPIIQAQIVETALLNTFNFQTLVATKAARCVVAAEGDPVIEFGLRRAQGVDGGVSASRAAYVGGCVGTSNVLAGQRWGIPVRGTHAHSWVMAFDSELESFRAYAEAMPNNCIFLVDTYDTLQGVRNAVTVGRELRERGHEMVGVRIDSGDLAWLSRRAREVLDDGGFPNALVLASNELDEHVIASLKLQDAAIDMWGVGTRLVTGHAQAALGGVYKLSAVRRPRGEWEPRIKVSEQTAKVTTPGVLQVRRFHGTGGSVGDMVFDTGSPPEGRSVMIDPADPTRRKSFETSTPYVDLLVPVFRAGKLVYDAPPLAEVRERALAQVAGLDPAHRRFLNPHSYAVGIEASLHDVRTGLILKARGNDETPDARRRT